jgi:tetratricopeptide (TPR) repeat protein
MQLCPFRTTPAIHWRMHCQPLYKAHYMVSRYRYALVLLAHLLSAGAVAQGSPHLRQAEQLLGKGQFKQAYALLEPEQFIQSGNPEFDYLFGLAALESGQPSVATLALERVLALRPNHSAARLDMGRAYLALGDVVRAQREFDFALALNPPPAAVALIQRYRLAASQNQTQPTTRASGYIEAGFGTDSNVTQGPADNNVYVPFFRLNFTLSPSSQKVQDDFGQMGAGVEIAHRLHGGKSLYGGVDTRWRSYSKVQNTEYVNTDWRGGVQWVSGLDVWRVGLGYGDYRLLQQPYRTTVSVSTEFRRQLSQRQQFTAFGQYAQTRYEARAQYNNNTDQWVSGVGWFTQLATARPTVVSASGFVGSETEETKSRPRADGDKVFVGLRIGATTTPYPNWDLFASASAQAAEYDRSNIVYSAKRVDNQYELSMGAVWRFAPAWSLKPQANWIRNTSNIQTSDYERYEASLFLRRDFR